MQRRSFNKQAQFRAEQNEDGTHSVTGYASMFNNTYPIGNGVFERIAPGAFDEALLRADLDVTVNVNHDDSIHSLLGRSGKNATLSVDNIGLRFDVQLLDNTAAKDLGVLMKAGVLEECSFAFTVDPANILSETQADGTTLETIRSIDKLFDVAVVVRGANPATHSAYRSQPEPESNENYIAIAREQLKLTRI